MKRKTWKDRKCCCGCGRQAETRMTLDMVVHHECNFDKAFASVGYMPSAELLAKRKPPKPGECIGCQPESAHRDAREGGEHDK